jgi:uncharacterized protein YhhL (DUF1145 family)
MSVPKIVLIGVWLVCAVGVVTGAQTGILYWAGILFWLMAIVHAGEFFVFRGELMKSGGSTAHHFVNTLFFGFLHLQEVRQTAGEGTGSTES